MTGKIVCYHPEVPEGIYIVKYIGYETGISWNSKKVTVKFSIAQGKYEGMPLVRYYNAITLENPIGANGVYTVGDLGYLVKEFRTLFPSIQATSEIDLNLYKDKLIRVEVETVNKTGVGEELSKSNCYSVIRRLIEIVPESFEADSLSKLG